MYIHTLERHVFFGREAGVVLVVCSGQYEKGCDPFWNFEVEASKVLQLSQHEADEISILERCVALSCAHFY